MHKYNSLTNPLADSIAKKHSVLCVLMLQRNRETERNCVSESSRQAGQNIAVSASKQIVPETEKHFSHTIAPAWQHTAYKFSHDMVRSNQLVATIS